MKMTKNTRRMMAVGVFLWGVMLAVTGFAEVPRKINYQGYLTNASGKPINGTVSMTCAIYAVATGGTALWSETQSVLVKNGIYNIRLGNVTPIKLTEAKTYYLGIKVGADSEMTPRQELTSGLYALFVEGLTLQGTSTVVGNYAGTHNTGSYNTFLGRYAGTSNTSGEANTFVGDYAGRANTTSSYNTFIGEDAGRYNTTGKENTFIGCDAGLSSNGSYNTFMGYEAGLSSTTSYYNIFIGHGAGRSNTTGISNIFIGRQAGYASTGGWNVFIGTNTGDSNTSGNYNTFVGHNTGNANTTGYHNTFIGQQAGSNNTTGHGNVFIGSGAGINETGSNKLHIGTHAVPLIYGEFDNRIVAIKGNLQVRDINTETILIEMGKGLDYAEGFDVADSITLEPGTVLSIDPENPGKLEISRSSYDTKVAGIVAGANGMGSGVRLGADQFDYDVALAGRVYCNVDATYGEVSPGDLLTTSPTPGYAMVVHDYPKAQGAILGKAMEHLEQGKKGQILVLVTLQ